MKTVALIIIVTLMMAMGTTSRAVASDNTWKAIGKVLVLALAAGAVASQGQCSYEAEPMRQPMQYQDYNAPMAPATLGNVIIKVGGNWGGGVASESAAKICRQVGFSPLNEEARRIAEAEAKRLGCKPAAGSARYVAIVSITQGNGPEWSSDYRGRRSSESKQSKVVWAHVTLNLYEGGVAIASAEAEASDLGTRYENCYSWWRSSSRYSSFSPSRRDLATAAALQMAAERIAEQLAPRAEWQFDPNTGDSLGNAVYACPLCRRDAPAGAKYCPFDGTSLSRVPEAAPASYPRLPSPAEPGVQGCVRK